MRSSESPNLLKRSVRFARQLRSARFRVIEDCRVEYLTSDATRGSVLGLAGCNSTSGVSRRSSLNRLHKHQSEKRKEKTLTAHVYESVCDIADDVDQCDYQHECDLHDEDRGELAAIMNATTTTVANKTTIKGTP